MNQTVPRPTQASIFLHAAMATSTTSSRHAGFGDAGNTTNGGECITFHVKVMLVDET